MKLKQYLKEDQYIVVKDYMQLGKEEFKPEEIELVHTQLNKVERIGKNWVGNIYKKRWVGYFLAPSKPSINTIHNKKYNIEIIFNSKKDMNNYIEKIQK